MQTFYQINSTIGSTSEFGPHTLCMSMHKSTLDSSNRANCQQDRAIDVGDSFVDRSCDRICDRFCDSDIRSSPHHLIAPTVQIVNKIVRLTLAIALSIEVVIEIVIAFVIQTFDQVHITIGSTSEFVPHTLCVYTHRSTLVYIYICPNVSVASAL